MRGHHRVDQARCGRPATRPRAPKSRRTCSRRRIACRVFASTPNRDKTSKPQSSGRRSPRRTSRARTAPTAEGRRRAIGDDRRIAATCDACWRASITGRSTQRMRARTAGTRRRPGRVHDDDGAIAVNRAPTRSSEVTWVSEAGGQRAKRCRERTAERVPGEDFVRRDPLPPATTLPVRWKERGQPPGRLG